MFLLSEAAAEVCHDREITFHICILQKQRLYPEEGVTQAAMLEWQSRSAPLSPSGVRDACAEHMLLDLEQ